MNEWTCEEHSNHATSKPHIVDIGHIMNDDDDDDDKETKVISNSRPGNPSGKAFN